MKKCAKLLGEDDSSVDDEIEQSQHSHPTLKILYAQSLDEALHFLDEMGIKNFTP